MALISQRDALRPAPSYSPARHAVLDEGDPFDLNDFEAEMKRLAAANDELMAELLEEGEENPEQTSAGDFLADAEELAMLRMENADLKTRLHELEASAGEAVWLERQREYELLLEEKSEVIRGLHQKMQEMQETAGSGESAPASAGVGQAEEILRLKREMEEERMRLQQDEEEMMGQMRQMEMTMAKERAEMARQRQEMTRAQADLAHEIEHTSGRDSELRERLQNLRRPGSGSMAALPVPAAVNPDAPAAPPPQGQNSSGFFRRIFG